MKELKVKVTFIRELLGTQTGDKDICRTFIGSKAPNATSIEDEIEAVGVDEVVEKGKTFFPKADGQPFIYDYQIRGFIKSAISAMNKVEGSKASKVKAFKKKVDTTIFVKDRMNIIENITEIGECQRPLRCSTMQGERVSIAISEMIPAGATTSITIQCLIDSDVELVKEALDYGRFNGFLQWRNSGCGSFTWEEIK